jgi:hypothetical protein
MIALSADDKEYGQYFCVFLMADRGRRLVGGVRGPQAEEKSFRRAGCVNQTLVPARLLGGSPSNKTGRERVSAPRAKIVGARCRNPE